MGAVSVVQRVRAANKPGPPEHSVALRVAAAWTVGVGIAACAAEGELGVSSAALAVAGLAVGSLFSHRRRMHPTPWLKLVLAIVAVIAFWWFFFAISKADGVTNLGAVLGPLAVLFTWIQVTHSFDVPSRRDLAFSLVGSVTLMAVAAAEALDMGFALFVVAWAAGMLVGLASMWGSMSGGRARVRAVVAGGVVLVGIGLACLLVLPAPSVSSRLVFPSSLAGDVAIGSPAGLEGTGAGATEPVRAGAAGGRVGVGGFLGFAGPLDTAVRGALGNELVFRVRASRPTFWVAETFDDWNGQSWLEVAPRGVQWHELTGASPFEVGPTLGAASGAEDIQTFYLVQPGPNLVFHADSASQVWFPADRIYVDREGDIRSGTSMGPGSVYTVVSSVDTPTPAQLAAANGPPLGAAALARFTQLPHPYPRVAALARRITAHSTTTEAKVLALEAWMGRHTRYTTDIAPLPKSADTVEQFLFVSRRGYCEQISTSLAVMLRTLGIPTREATGYVPGQYNPITDLYDIEAKDAHAWVQVWFPGLGWESFDPTAFVAEVNPSPAATIGHDVLGAVRRIPAVPSAAIAAALVLGAALWRRRARRPATPAAAVGTTLERAARRAGLQPSSAESLAALARRIDAVAPPGPGEPERVAHRRGGGALGVRRRRDRRGGRGASRPRRRARCCAGCRGGGPGLSPNGRAPGPRRRTPPRPAGADRTSAGGGG